jgi:hypothetical protein
MSGESLGFLCRMIGILKGEDKSLMRFIEKGFDNKLVTEIFISMKF